MSLENWFAGDQCGGLANVQWPNMGAHAYPFDVNHTELYMAASAGTPTYLASDPNLNNQPTVVFNTSSSFQILNNYAMGSYNFPTAQFITYYTTGTNTTLIGNGGRDRFLYLQNGNVMMEEFAYPYFATVSPDLYVTSYHYYNNTGVNGVGKHTICWVNGMGMQIWVDGKLVWNRPTYYTIYPSYYITLGCASAGSGTTATGGTADSQQPFAGEIPEYMHFTRAMSNSEIQDISYYMMIKYGVTPAQ